MGNAKKSKVKSLVNRSPMTGDRIEFGCAGQRAIEPTGNLSQSVRQSVSQSVEQAVRQARRQTVRWSEEAHLTQLCRDGYLIVHLAAGLFWGQMRSLLSFVRSSTPLYLSASFLPSGGLAIKADVLSSAKTLKKLVTKGLAC